MLGHYSRYSGSLSLLVVLVATLALAAPGTPVHAGPNTRAVMERAGDAWATTPLQAVDAPARLLEQTGTACTAVVGGTCTVTGTGSGTVGTVTGTGTKTASMNWTLSASIAQGVLGIPAVPTGTIPTASIQTTLGTQTLTCTAVTINPGGASTTCSGTTTGDALQGSVVTVTFIAGATATGTVTGSGTSTTGTGCAATVGTTCTVTGTGTGTVGTVTGTGTKTASMSWTLTANIPQGVLGIPAIPPGTVPTASFQTTVGTETITCTAVTVIPGGASTTCTGSTTGDALQGSTVTVTFVAGATATGTISGAGAAGGSVTVQQAIGLVQRTGQPGVPCSLPGGPPCNINGQVNGSGLPTGGMNWNLNVAVPVGVAAGVVPVAVVSTVPSGGFGGPPGVAPFPGAPLPGLPGAPFPGGPFPGAPFPGAPFPGGAFPGATNLEGFTCTTVAAGLTTVTCNGTTAGVGQQGSTVTVMFTAGVTTTGIATGPGLPPPPPPLPPPPPPPPPPPFPPAPGPGAGASAPLNFGPGRTMPEVPIIPEADTLPLLGAGVIALAGLAGLRAARRTR